MDIKLALLADAANLSKENKLNILGVFHDIYAAEFPARHPEMQLVLNMEASTAEAGSEKKLEVKLMNDDGELVAEMAGTIKVPERPHPGFKIKIGLILPLRDTVFPAPGQYGFSVLIDGNEGIQVPLTLSKREEGEANAS